MTQYKKAQVVRLCSSEKTHQLYIISDDEIKEGDWIMRNETNVIEKALFDGASLSILWKKIIASTDPSLDLPQPSQEFIEYYISEYNKGNIINDVQVEYKQIKLFIEPQNLMQYRSQPAIFQHPHTTDPEDIWGLKVSSDNTIHIKTVKEIYTRDEVVALIHKFQNTYTYASNEIGVNLWIKENL